METPAASESEGTLHAGLPRQSRIVLLPLPENISDIRVQQAIAEAGGVRRKRPPKDAKRGKDRFSNLQTGAKKPPPPPPLTLTQQRQIARAVFRAALVEKLRSNLRVSVVSDEAALNAVNALQITPGTPLSPEKAGLLAAKLDADAVLNITRAELQIPQASPQIVLWRVTIQQHGPRFGPEQTSVVALPAANLFASGAVQEEASLFGLRRPQSAGHRAALAARQAASRAVHTLKTGEVLPLCLPNVKLALAPIPAPPTADKLLFLESGRTVRKNAVRDLPAEVSSLFQPDLLPLLPPSVLPAYRLRRELQNQNLAASALWKKEDTPDIALAQRIARKAGADYALIACISDLEVDAGPNAPNTDNTAFGGSRAEGRAEAVGILLRVADGKILWSDHATAVLRGDVVSVNATAIQRRDQAVAHNVTRFALLELERRFQHYVARFEQ